MDVHEDLVKLKKELKDKILSAFSSGKISEKKRQILLESVDKHVHDTHWKLTSSYDLEQNTETRIRPVTEEGELFSMSVVRTGPIINADDILHDIDRDRLGIEKPPPRGCLVALILMPFSVLGILLDRLN